MRPHINCATASARLMAPTPSPVVLFRGDMKSPSDCRAPIVTMRMAAAASVTTQALRPLLLLSTGIPRKPECSAHRAVGPLPRRGADDEYDCRKQYPGQAALHGR